MKACKTLIALLLFSAGLSKSSALANTPQGAVHPMTPAVVNERPLGFIGIRHATAKFDILRLITFRHSLQFLQIDDEEPGCAGQRAGIMPGDQIIAVNGRALRNWGLSALKTFGDRVEAGQHVKVRVYRPSTREYLNFDVVVSGKKRGQR